MSSLCQLIQPFFDLVRYSFASRVYAVVREAPCISFRNENMDFVVGIFLAERVSQEVEMLWVSPESDVG